MNRRLAAILAADVVGYSRLVELDETGTLGALRERRSQILDPSVARHHGRVVKVMGDGVLLEFGSAVNAVFCATELQRQFAAANESLAEDRRIALRIGVNLGDVVVEGGDLFGDGVILAVRLQAMAKPGGICVSGSVHDQVAGKLDAAFEDMGLREVKNSSKPVRVYEFLGPKGDLGASRAAPPPSEKPLIAVLPFSNLSGNAQQQYLCDGLTEDIITELSRFRQMQVISRNSSSRFRGTDIDMIRVGRELGAHYLVEGSVRQMAGRTRITAQLIDAATGVHIWAERYDSAQHEIFDIQDRVVRTIVGTLAGRMNWARTELARRKPPASLAAYEYVLRGDALPVGTPEIEAEARHWFGRAIELDPGYARAYALLSGALERQWYLDMSGSNRLRDEAFELAHKAVLLDENDPLCQVAIAWAQINREAYEVAEQHLAKAIALNPNHPVHLADMAIFDSYRGEPEKAIDGMLEAKRLDAFFNPSWYWGELGSMYFNARRYDDAIASMRRSTTLSCVKQAWLAASYALSGKPDDAKHLVEEILRQVPEFSIARFLPKEPLLRREDRQHLAEGLRKAGFQK
ncbi:adenylate/guanylate cyclase domain-containing protein (plasmid) [Rhizobium ruizarguesonis]|uniref:adenylate/guanylate cyclase domain-containing protein n=1 Tax=Rhizobium ruizarguesonis TaxID=2081791 RepID=UPI0010319A85|nr:adenylate/guanylate cyclase domain-containing protein [Rhizobium ruizarguesonis]TAX66767.1 adenylate/guanylate cyclase domain-containing protein [Rhizobium ruizarguesonis]